MLQTQNSWFNKGGQCASHPNSSHRTTGDIFTPWWSPLLSSAGIFPAPLEATPQISQAALGFVPKSTCSLQSGHGAAPLGIDTSRAKAASGLEGSCWYCMATVCLPTFSSVAQEPKLLLPSSLWDGTGFIFSSTEQWLLSKTA